jgi:hypothetical protein
MDQKVSKVVITDHLFSYMSVNKSHITLLNFNLNETGKSFLQNNSILMLKKITTINIMISFNRLFLKKAKHMTKHGTSLYFSS